MEFPTFFKSLYKRELQLQISFRRAIQTGKSRNPCGNGIYPWPECFSWTGKLKYQEPACRTLLAFCCFAEAGSHVSEVGKQTTCIIAKSLHLTGKIVSIVSRFTPLFPNGERRTTVGRYSASSSGWTGRAAHNLRCPSRYVHSSGVDRRLEAPVLNIMDPGIARQLGMSLDTVTSKNPYYQSAWQVAPSVISYLGPSVLTCVDFSHTPLSPVSKR